MPPPQSWLAQLSNSYVVGSLGRRSLGRVRIRRSTRCLAPEPLGSRRYAMCTVRESSRDAAALSGLESSPDSTSTGTAHALCPDKLIIPHLHLKNTDRPPLTSPLLSAFGPPLDIPLELYLARLAEGKNKDPVSAISPQNSQITRAARFCNSPRRSFRFHTLE